MRREKIKRKRKDRRKEGNKNRRVFWTFHTLIHITQSGEAVFAKRFTKTDSTPHIIHSTSTATVRAATATAEPYQTHLTLFGCMFGKNTLGCGHGRDLAGEGIA
jgi:hypothetical protein